MCEGEKQRGKKKGEERNMYLDEKNKIMGKIKERIIRN